MLLIYYYTNTYIIIHTRPECVNQLFSQLSHQKKNPIKCFSMIFIFQSTQKLSLILINYIDVVSIHSKKASVDRR